MELSVVTVDPLRVACLRHVGPFNTIAESWGKFHQIPEVQQLAGPSSQWISIFHCPIDRDTPEEQLQSDCAITIDQSVHPSEPLTLGEVPGGRYVTALYIGPYEEMDTAWDAVTAAAKEQGHPIAEFGTSFEVYLNDPTITPPVELRTQIYLPLETHPQGEH